MINCFNEKNVKIKLPNCFFLCTSFESHDYFSYTGDTYTIHVNNWRNSSATYIFKFSKSKPRKKCKGLLGYDYFHV